MACQAEDPRGEESWVQTPARTSKILVIHMQKYIPNTPSFDGEAKHRHCEVIQCCL